MNKKPIIVLTRKLPDVVEKRMEVLFEVKINNNDKQMSKDELIHHSSYCDVLVPTVTDNIDNLVIKSGKKNLKLIANFGNGVDHIDLETAFKEKITVTNTPRVLTEDTADVSMGLILSVPRRLFEGNKILEMGQWQGWSPNFMLGRRLYGKKLGILGMGRIGTAIAKRAKSFGLSISYHNRNRVAKEIENELGASYFKSLDEMMKEMDIISINCPHTSETYQLISEKRLSLMKKDSYIVNTSRGEVIDEEALINILQQKKIMGAGLDVYKREPNVDPRLLKLDNVILLPHMSSATLESRVEMGERVIINIRSMVDGHKPPDRVIAGTTL
ncbi:D-glycerate dehydrogenase [Alphaproteobacteria bacterium]|nr:D-glycerate dehydrogenase [Alphaproteobacteria bacterium]